MCDDLVDQSLKTSRCKLCSITKPHLSNVRADLVNQSLEGRSAVGLMLSQLLEVLGELGLPLLHEPTWGLGTSTSQHNIFDSEKISQIFYCAPDGDSP